MNPSRGNMYGFVNYTWNPIRGCEHDCKYCYMKAVQSYDMTPRFIESEMNTNLGKGNAIFVGSTCDMFGEWVEKEWIDNVLKHCNRYQNTYLFQTKNPRRFKEFIDKFPERTMLATTIESNRHYNIGNAPEPSDRAAAMFSLLNKFPKMISIEPIMDFDIDIMILWLKQIAPRLVSIGADSKSHNLIEPDRDKILELIKRMRMFTNVKQKQNLNRLL